MSQLSGAVIILSCSGLALGQSTSTPCSEVQNREFSDDVDVDQNGVSDPGQVLWFDCFGGALDNPFRDVVEPNNFGLQVDALANRNDRLFLPFVSDGVEMIFSVEDDRNIYFEREQTGAFGLWNENVARQDVDALEVWGDSNSDHHSFQGDPGGVSLVYEGTLGIQNVMQSQLLAGIQSLGIGLSLQPEDLDLDAAMRWNEAASEGLLAFSVVPVDDGFGNVILDGGEIFVLNLDTSTAEFLFHGGHQWDTDFEVMGTFGLDNENINAIEAVAPTPSALALLAIGGFFERRRCRRIGQTSSHTLPPG